MEVDLVMSNLAFILPISIIGLLVDIWFIRTEYAGKMLKATVLKGCASYVFVCLGSYCYVKQSSDIGTLILIGLILGFVGDVLLNLRNLYEGAISNRVFALGILAFLSGHFLYIAFLVKQAPSKIFIAVILTIAIAVLSIPPLMKRITAPSKGLKIFGYVYLTVVIAMFSCAVAQVTAIGVSKLTCIFLLGALLFLVSDFIMIYYSFGKKIKPLRAINLLAYYVGQLLIATCILFIS